MAGSRSRAFVALSGVGLMVASACTDARPRAETGATVGTSRELLSKDEYGFEGMDLPAKTLIFTFDDGPGSPAVVKPLLAFLKTNNIKATFFVNGACIADLPKNAKGKPDFSDNESCDEPDEDAVTSMQLMVADGHMIGNHTSTHRSLTGENGPLLPPAESIEDLTFTHNLIKSYSAWNRLMFRPPFGDWQDPNIGQGPDGDTKVYTKLTADPTLATYTGPVYWSIGGAITAHSAADWDCWGRNWPTKQCGDLYLDEISRVGKGIVLMHNAKGNPDNHNINSGQGNSIDMVKYIVPQLLALNYTFKPLWEDPAIAAAFPKCDASCATCSGPASTNCLTCASSAYLSSGSCKTCSTCAAGTFASAACSATADTACQTCSTCAAGDHAVAACTPMADTSCVHEDGTPVPTDAGTTSGGTPTISGGTGTATADGGSTGDAAAPSDGGCSTAPGGSSFSAIGLAGVALLFRRRRRARIAQA